MPRTKPPVVVTLPPEDGFYEETVELVPCEWFALCDQAAQGTMPHPILGDVPCCQRCANVVGGTLVAWTVQS